MSGLESLDAPPANPAPRTLQLGRYRIHILQTGWVRVKRSHRKLSGPVSLRLPRLLLDPQWTEWLPIHCYAVEYAEGVLLVDTGESSDCHADDYFKCGPGLNWFYRGQLRFAVRREDEVDRQLAVVGIQPADVREVVLTHLHSDHVGGARHFLKVPLIVNGGDWAGHPGSLRCRIPSSMTHRETRLRPEPFGAFASSCALDRNANLRVVPSPGHSAGHQSVLMRTEDENWVLFGGDLAFSVAQINRTELAGIVEDPKQARSSLAKTLRQIRTFSTQVYLGHEAPTEATRSAGEGRWRMNLTKRQ